MSKGKLIIYTGCSGVGKGTIMEELLKDETLRLSVSCTTRAPRPGETHGKQYFFITKEEFEKVIEEQGFLDGNHPGNADADPDGGCRIRL